ncbi:O-antigen ligase [Methylophilus rhizosphaerae]|uniref:O-antigen ligase n=1 Tax=Methylophilus rhizosphaerae TaxID=492660 RepID=A0A1G9DCJ3_9PROT|nr:O-antigen ligase family protein [Methylophilus rhizosphaerae]SDK61626.1 O-antigen ligase [Methylophilus rhizosphaerae]
MTGVHSLSSAGLAVPRYLAWACLFFAVMIIGWSPFSGGARLPTLLLAIVGCWWLLTMLPALSKQRAVRRWTSVFLLLWLPMWLSLLHAFSTPATLAAIGWFSLMYLAGLVLVVLLQQPLYRNLLVRGLSWIVAVWLLDSGIQYLLGTDLLGIAKTPEGRITGMFTDLHQGILMLAVLPAIFYYLQARHAWLAWGILLGAGVVVTLSGARGYLYIYGLILLLGLWRRRPDWKAWLIALSLPLLVATFSSLLNPQLAKSKLEATQSLTANNQSWFDRANHALSYRLNLWETGLHMWQAEPVTGIGSNNYKRAYKQYASRVEDPFVMNPTHSHNIYVEWLAETGIVGGLGLVAIIGLCVRWFRQAGPACQQQAWPYALPLLVIYFPLNTTQPMLVPWWFPVLMLLACAFVASLERGSHDTAA